MIKVSIIIPTYNRKSILKETLSCIQNQTLKEWECLIIDDGSTDKTEYMVDEIQKADSRFRYYKRPSNYKKGAATCRNYGFLKSVGKYVQWLDDDDFLSENKLELQVKQLEKYSKSNLISTCAWDEYWEGKKFDNKSVINENDFLTKFNYFDELYKKSSFIPIHSFLMTRKIIKISGSWNEELTVNDDAEFFSRILLNAEKIVFTKGCYVQYNCHAPLRLSKTNNSKGLKSYLLSLKLIHQHFECAKIDISNFLRWKLLNILYNYWSKQKLVILSYKELYTKCSINLAFAYFYLLKYRVYRIFILLYKKLFK